MRSSALAEVIVVAALLAIVCSGSGAPAAPPVDGARVGRAPLPGGLTLEAEVGASPVSLLAPIPLRLAFVNETNRPLDAPDAARSYDEGYLDLSVRFEDGHLCLSRSWIGCGAPRPPLSPVAPGARREVLLDLQKVATLEMPGRYRIEVVYDPGPDLERARLPTPLSLTLHAPGRTEIEAYAPKVPLRRELARCSARDLRRLAGFDDPLAEEWLRILRERVEHETKLGVRVPGVIADEIRFSEERSRVMGLVRRGDWNGVASYLDEPRRREPLRRELQDLLAAAYAPRIPRAR